MSVASDLKTLLETTGYPAEQGEYTGTEDKYFTFDIPAHPDLFAGDVPNAEVYMPTIHFVCPATFNSTVLQKTVKDLLINNGYIYPSSFDMSDDPAEQDIVFETETDVGI